MAGLKLIINADDYGFSQSTNDAIKELFELGKLKSTTVMVNMPFAKQIVELKKEELGIGLHLNLTQGKPVSDPDLISSLVDENGEFYTFKIFRNRILRNKIKSKHLKIEIKNQFQLLTELLGQERVDHWDSHQGIHRFPRILNISRRVSLSKGISKIRTHKHIFLVRGKNGISLKEPLKNKTIFSLFRILKELYYKLYYSLSARKLNFPSYNLGIINGTTVDLIDLIDKCSIDEGFKIELACHPATTDNDLPHTTITDQRVNEYLLLKEKEFNPNIELINYSEI